MSARLDAARRTLADADMRVIAVARAVAECPMPSLPHDGYHRTRLRDVVAEMMAARAEYDAALTAEYGGADEVGA